MSSVEISGFSIGDLNRIGAQLYDHDCAEAHLCRLLKDCLAAEALGHAPVVTDALRECRGALQAALLHVLTHKGWDLHLLRAPVWTNGQALSGQRARQET